MPQTLSENFLLKRKRGAPLSQAEIEQRRAAGRKRRKLVAAAGTTTAAAAGFVGGAKLADKKIAQKLRERGHGVVQANKPLADAVARRAARRAFIDRHAAASVIPGESSADFIPTVRRHLQRQRGQAVQQLIAHIKPYAEERDGGYLTPVAPAGDGFVPADAREAQLAGNIPPLDAALTDLQQARGRQVMVQAGYIAHDPAHERTAKVGAKRLLWSRNVSRKPDFMDVSRPLSMTDAGPSDATFTLREIEADLLAGGEREYGAKRLLREAGIKLPKIGRAKVVQQVAARTRVVPPTITRTPLYPPMKERIHLGEMLDQHRAGRLFDINVANDAKQAARIAAARSAKRAIIGRALRQAAMLRAGRGGLVGLAALAGAAGAAGLVHLVGQQLNKADDTAGGATDDKRPADIKIARSLAGTYRDWMLRILGDQGKAMDLEGDLDRAMSEHIESAFVQGAQNPPVRTDDSKTVAFGFDQRDPQIQQWAADYSGQKVVEISDAQRTTLRDIVQQHLSEGRPPAEMARQIKQGIGLTTYQASLVDSFRTQLDTLDPKVLGRALRDKRFDRTVSKAIETGVNLTADQVNKMTDAYHRRAVAMRAMTIGRTEALRAVNRGAYRRVNDWLGRNPDFDAIKVWIATDDDRTRPDHRELNGREVTGMQTPFVTQSGAELQMPLDDDAPADEVVNCRCTMYYRIVPKAKSMRFVRPEELI